MCVCVFVCVCVCVRVSVRVCVPVHFIFAAALLLHETMLASLSQLSLLHSHIL